MIERKAKVTVNEWITHGNDAFLLTGARQIGKTYLIRQCLKESGYPYIEFNFIEQPELVNLFAGAKDAKELLMRLSVVAKEPLEQGKTIIFLDEIQEFKDIVTRIKFLVEDGTFRYIMSGSLLGVELNDLRSAPVGYLEIYDMYPLDFKEFVRAAGLKNDVILMLEDHFKKRNPVDDFIHSKMLDLFYLYLIVGGMPEAVAVYLETNDLAKVAKVHEKIIRLYKTDFSKYEKNYKLKLQEIYDAMPGQLDQKNKRFQFFIWSVQILVDDTLSCKSCCPPSCLLRHHGAIESKIKIFVIFCNSNFRIFNNLRTSMIYDDILHNFFSL